MLPYFLMYKSQIYFIIRYYKHIAIYFLSFYEMRRQLIYSDHHNSKQVYEAGWSSRVIIKGWNGWSFIHYQTPSENIQSLLSSQH